ncbi:MAG: LacI family DNA-binding transcriptional regulator [Chloroflexota bacterium]
MATIDDVARRAGVSSTTVSHALSGKRPVAPATRLRIVAAAEELHYHPNAAASSLRAGRTHTVGLSLLLDTPGRTLSHGPFSAFIEHIADHLSEHGHTLLTVVRRDPGPDDLGRLARSGQVDGMILLQVRVHDERIAALRAANLPFVAIGRPADTRGLVCVDADLAAAGALAARHLFDLGHTRLGFLCHTPVFGYQYHALAGFRGAHRRAGIPLQRSQFLRLDPATGLRGTLAPYIASATPLTGLITTTDIEAVTALHLLTGQGLRVPDDVSVITLGDSVLTQLARPPITAVAFSVADESILSVDLLLKMIDGRLPRQHVYVLPVQLLTRQSTGPARPPRRPANRLSSQPAAPQGVGGMGSDPAQ